MSRFDVRSTMSVSSPGEIPLRRLRRLAPLSEREAALVMSLGAHQQAHPAGTELFGEGHMRGRPKVVLSGWACRCRLLPDGRRQIFTFVLPGDFLGLCSKASPGAMTTAVALTRVVTADAAVLAEAAFERDDEFDGLHAAVNAADHLDDASLLDQIVRLGRQTAYERTAHLFLELHWRLQAVGLASDRRFPMPLTQEVLADALGLSIVHVNRTMQQLRRDGLIETRGGYMELLQPELMVAACDFRPPRHTRPDRDLPETDAGSAPLRE